MKKENATLKEVFECLENGGKAWAIDAVFGDKMELCLDHVGALSDTRDMSMVGILSSCIEREDYIVEPKEEPAPRTRWFKNKDDIDFGETSFVEIIGDEVVKIRKDGSTSVDMNWTIESAERFVRDDLWVELDQRPIIVQLPPQEFEVIKTDAQAQFASIVKENQYLKKQLVKMKDAKDRQKAKAKKARKENRELIAVLEESKAPHEGCLWPGSCQIVKRAKEAHRSENARRNNEYHGLLDSRQRIAEELASERIIVTSTVEACNKLHERIADLEKGDAQCLMCGVKDGIILHAESRMEKQGGDIAGLKFDLKGQKKLASDYERRLSFILPEVRKASEAFRAMKEATFK